MIHPMGQWCPVDYPSAMVGVHSVTMPDPSKIEKWIEERAAAYKLAETLVVAKAEAGRLGLFRTMRALDDATQQFGWELAAKHDPQQKALGENYMRMKG